MPDVPLASLAPPSPLANQVAGFPGQARGMLADMFGITDAMRALRGEMTPEEAQNFALTSAAGLIPLPGAAEAAAPLTRLAEKMTPEAAETAIPLASKAIRAYHGSPYDFDRFDLSKIGTGEGAQAYGHGLYMAENPEVAQSYKKAGQMFGNYKPDENYAGHLYEVNINADPEHFLDWDKPLSEQSPQVQEALKSQGITNLEGVKYASQNPEAVAALRQAGIPGIKYLDQGSRVVPTSNGRIQFLNGKYHVVDAFGTQAGPFDTQEAAQQALQPQNQTHNYVVFDDKLVDIIKKYGLAGLIAGGAAHYSLPADNQSQVPLSSLQQ